MFTVDSEKIGSYLGNLIKNKGYKDRQFCIEYLRRRDGKVNPDDIPKMQNRICQIKQGKKGIQLEDLPIFSEILGATFEEILSAGNYYVPDATRLTNYSVAFSRDPEIWESYVNNEDDIFLNYDEYGKSIIDYAIEFKNYKLLKYLMDKDYIWFIDEEKEKNFFYQFGAGTSVKRRKCTDPFSWELYIAETDQLRTDMVRLAIENQDYDLLDKLHARETPELYQPMTYSPNDVERDFFNERLIDCVVHANKKVIKYFTESFSIDDKNAPNNLYIFPYVEEIVQSLLKNNSKCSVEVLCGILEHNQRALDGFNKIIKEEMEASRTDYLDYSDEVLFKIATHFFFVSKSGLVARLNTLTTKKSFSAAAIHMDVVSKDDKMQQLINSINSVYDSIVQLGGK